VRPWRVNVLDSTPTGCDLEVGRVVMSGPGAGWDPPPPSPTEQEVNAAAEALLRHADDPDTGMCPECAISRCQPRREAESVLVRDLLGEDRTDSAEVDQRWGGQQLWP
jgi:hypothetical protein